MIKPILLLLFNITVCQFGLTKISPLEKEKLENFRFSIEYDFDIQIKIDRLTQQKHLDNIIKTLPILGVVADINHKRNEFGEITFLQFQSDTMSCSSDDFGALSIVIKNNKLWSCGAANYSYIVEK